MAAFKRKFRHLLYVGTFIIVLFVVTLCAYKRKIIDYREVTVTSDELVNEPLVTLSEVDPSEFHTSTQNLKSKSIDIFKENLDQYDSCLIDFIRLNYVLLPSTKRYNFTEFPARSSEEPLIDLIQDLFPNKKGFFVECNANDGELSSNTLTLEIDYQWNGLLIEAQAESFKNLKSKNRKAWLVNLCLSSNNFSQRVKLSEEKSKSSNTNASKRDRKSFEETYTDCAPLFSILKAINVSHVDYLSLGNELEALKTIPFDLITFNIISVDYWFVPANKQKAITTLLATKGFILVRQIVNSYTRDAIYIRSSLKSLLPTP